MNAIVVRLQDLPGLENVDPSKMSAAEVEAAVRRCFAFFPKSANIRIAGEIVTIELPEAAVADAAEAARLAPEQDVGMDLEEPFLTALQLFDAKKGGQ